MNETGFEKTAKPFKRKEMVAWCSSDYCIRAAKLNKRKTSYGRGAKKVVIYSTIFCPDCQQALFWESVEGASQNRSSERGK